jgi:hypothetical protein
VSSDNRRKPRARRLPRSHTFILFAVGVVLVAAGLALAVAPEYSERAGHLADVLASSWGIECGVLLLGGLMSFSLGVLSRGISRLTNTVRGTPGPRKGEESADVSVVVEQLAGELAHLRAAVDRVSHDVGRTAETVQHLLRGQEELGQAQDQPSLANDPLLMMASSLDQLNARLDERLKALTAHIDERLATVRAQ